MTIIATPVAEPSYSDRWAALTLSSLVKKAAEFTHHFQEGECAEVAEAFSAKVDDGHRWLLEGSTPPVIHLLELVKVSHFLKEYKNGGDEDYLAAARLTLSRTE